MRVSATTDYDIELTMWLDNAGDENGKLASNDPAVFHYVEILNAKTKPLKVKGRVELPQGTRRLKFKSQSPPSRWDFNLRVPGALGDHAACGVEVTGSTGKEHVECTMVKYESQWKRGVWHSCGLNLPLSMTVEVI